MAEIIVYNKDDKTFIVTISPEMYDRNSATRKLLASRGVEFNSNEEVTQWVINKDIPANVPYYITDDSKLPGTRTFRDAWFYEPHNDQFSIDIDKAKEIRKEALKHERNVMLPEINNQYLMAIGSNDPVSKASLETKIFELNNFETIEFPDSLTELEDFKPDCFDLTK
jgi:hypothetical protein